MSGKMEMNHGDTEAHKAETGEGMESGFARRGSFHRGMFFGSSVRGAAVVRGQRSFLG